MARYKEEDTFAAWTVAVEIHNQRAYANFLASRQTSWYVIV